MKPRTRKGKRKGTAPAHLQYVPLACGGLVLRNLVTGLVARVR